MIVGTIGTMGTIGKHHSQEKEHATKEEEKKLLGSKSVCKGKDSKGRRKSSKGASNLLYGKEVESAPEYFGVRSYLHNFYESVTVKNPQLYEDIYEDDLGYLSRSKKRRLRVLRGCWRFSLMLGIIMLLAGLTFLLFGYLMPHKGVILGLKDGIEKIDKTAIRFNDSLNLCRIIGLIVFCGGGAVFCFALLLPVMINMQWEEDANREPFQVMFAPEEPPRSPTDKKIPATEELASIQPKREEEEEVVMTNSGLCKVPAPARSSEP